MGQMESGMFVGKTAGARRSHRYQTGHPPGFLQILRRFDVDLQGTHAKRGIAGSLKA
jgi:hypothetical protein